jgi:UDP-glucose 4-epimerase
MLGGEITEQVHVFDEDDKPQSLHGAWRIAVEEAVKNSSSNSLVDGVVVRPGYVYGGTGKSIAHMAWENDGSVIRIVGSPLKRFGWIHVEDLAALYAVVAEASPAIVGGEVFHGVDDTRVTHGEIVRALAQVSGFKGTFESVAVDPKSPWHLFAEQSCVGSYAKASRLLGWRPRHSNILDDLPTYYESWKAWKERERG